MNRKNRTICFLFIQIFIFFTFIERIHAKPTGIQPFDIDWSSGITGAVEETSGINNNRKRIVICSYACSNSNSGNSAGKCGETGELWNIITYQSEGDEQNKWKINAGIILNDFTIPSGLKRKPNIGSANIFVHEWKSVGTALPQTYYGSSTNGDKNQDWQKETQSYKDLYNSFVCPQYSFYDESATIRSCSSDYCKKYNIDNTMELCFADDTKSCSERNETDYTTFNNPNTLAFSFAEQLNSVLEIMKNKINNMTDEEVLRPYGLPKEEANSEEFLENICDLLSESLVVDQFGEGTHKKDILDKIIIDSYTEFERNKIMNNSSISKCGDGSNVTNIAEYEKCLEENNSIMRSYYNSEIYNFTDLSKLLVKDVGQEYKNVKYNNESMSEKFDDIINNVYVGRVKSATESYQKQCEAKHGRKYDLDTDQLENEIKASIDKIVTKWEIDLDDLNCDNIFSQFADTIKSAYFFLEIGAIIIAIALTILDYAKVILSSNQDEMKKTNQKLLKRLILVMVLFLLPAIINMTLKIFKIEGFNSDNPLCVNVTEK